MGPSTPRAPRTSFGWLNATQFLGALNDNVFKLLLVFFVIAQRGPETAARAGAMGLFLLAAPFLLFSALAGYLADRHGKQSILLLAKAAEVAIMLLGVAAFYFRSEFGLYATMFLMAAQSAFFSPVKYGIVPELVGKEGLSRANGLLQAFTYLAIIAGTVLAPWLSLTADRNYALASAFCVLASAAGLATGFGVRRTPPAAAKPAAPSLFFVRDIWRTLRSIRHDRYLLMAVFAAAYFSLLAAFLQINLIPYCIEELGISQEQGSYVFLFAAVGIGAGALLAGRLSGRNVELGVVPLGAAGLTLATLALGHSGHTLWGVRALTVLAGLGAGLFIVPLEAWIQFRSPPERRGRILAAAGFLGWVGVLLAAALLYASAEWLRMPARAGLTLLGWLTLALTLGTLAALPDFLLRFIAVFATRLGYRLRVLGAEHVPVEGPALLVCNHVSWMDALLLMATQQRRIRFLADRSLYSRRALRPFMRLMGVIPVSASDAPRRLVASLREARAALDDGFLVCVFAEGAVTRTGNLMAFKSGFHHIVRGSDIPIIPVYVGGAWGSIFSYAHGRLLTRWPLSFPYPVTILFGPPLPATVGSAALRQAVMELSCAYFEDRKTRRRPLAEEFVRAARRGWRDEAIADSGGRRLTAGRTLVAAVGLADRLRLTVADAPRVGVLLPPSVGGALANLAVALLGKPPVNLNYTASAEARRSAIAQCGIRTVLTSRAFLEKLGTIPPPEGAVYLEDLLADFSLDAGAKRRAWFKARFMPRRRLAASHGFQPDDPATVIFSSGSTGEPKGVQLSHHNIQSNIESLRAVFHPSPHDAVTAVLPFFHSLGFTATLWFPLLSGFKAVYHPNPLDAAAIGRLTREHATTLLFATPTFLMAYARRVPPEDFASLRTVVAGAEKLLPRVADAFEKRFNLRPLEGYGATELAPVATLNVPNVETGDARQVGAKEGTVGHPIPGVVVRVVDPETGAPLPDGAPGRLLVKGPNVMIGYLNRPELTAAAIRDGWYDTGDVAVRDEDGFVTIVDRLSRFSKIGGEMVPHLAIEEALQRAVDSVDRVLAVTSVPDEKKGERLVVLYTDAAGTPDDMRRALAACDLPNLWKPSPAALIRVESIPILGSGKLDLTAIRRRAAEEKEADAPTASPA